jgi:hypothetical protein
MLFIDDLSDGGDLAFRQLVGLGIPIYTSIEKNFLGIAPPYTVNIG